MLRHFPCAGPVTSVVACGNRGGFSGAGIWQIHGPTYCYCLKLWPVEGASRERLAWVHGLMDQAVREGLAFVPRVARTADGTSWVETEHGLWDLCTWTPGKADFHNSPGMTRLEAACTGLARLHAVWAAGGPRTGRAPAALRRRQRLEEWNQLVQSGWRPDFRPGDDPVRPWAERAWRFLEFGARRVDELLRPWEERSFPLQPCLCDVWHDHVLFEGSRLTGLIDFGSLRVDQVAADLARLLGSLAGDRVELWEAGLGAYRQVRALSAEEEGLMRVLDETGTILGAANWLRWLYEQKRDFEDRAAVATRLAALVMRMERQ